MKSCVLGLLFLLFSLHACSARPLGFGGKHADNNQDLMKISSAKVDDNRYYEHINLNKLLTTMRNSKAMELQEEYNIESDEVIKTIFQVSQGSAVDEEKWKMESRRSTLQSLSHHNNNAKPEETMNSSNQNEGHDDEEAVVMDYAQPHRKPPIHNKEP